MISTKGLKFPASTLTPAEVRRLVHRPSSRWPTGLRNKALLGVLWRCQLRVAECCDLLPTDVGDDSLHVREGKGRKSRRVGLDAGCAALIEAWRRRRACLALPNADASPLFCTLKGKPLSTHDVRVMIKRVALKAGITRRVHPHQLRHTGAAEMRREGVDIAVISKQLGHASIATTAHYLNHIEPREVIETVAGRVW